MGCGADSYMPLGDYRSLKIDLRDFKTASGDKTSGIGGRPKGYKLGQLSDYTKNGSGEIDNNTWSAAFIYSLDPHAIIAGYRRVSDDNFAPLNRAAW